MIDWPAVVSILLFYLLILFVGIWAARRQKTSGDLTDTENVMLAGRDINLVVGIFTMTATWVGGGYINGTAESVYSPGQGILWCQAPLGYTLSLIVGGMFFATKMREEGYVTMLDPFQNKFGEIMTGFLFIPALLGEIFWTASILSALGATISVVIDLPMMYSIIASACIALIYTVFGGLYSVAYTDVVQLFCIFIGMWLCIPFALTSDNLSPLNENVERYLGTVDPWDSASYIDGLLMLTLGGVPWQVYFQRVLSSKTATRAKILSYVASIGCFLMAIPAVLIGIAASKADWKLLGYKGIDEEGVIEEKNRRLVLPLVLQYLCPQWVSVIGLGAVSAAVMSSADSSVLSAASMFARNVIKPIFWQSANEKQIIWLMRFMMFFVGAISCVMGICIKSIYGLWYMCSDLVYVVLFPQLIAVLYMKSSNTYGSSASFIFGILFRLLTGDSILGIPPAFKFPGLVYLPDGKFYQRWPTKTISMLISLMMVVGVSLLFQKLYEKNILTEKMDIFNCFYPNSKGTPGKKVDSSGKGNETHTLIAKDAASEDLAENIVLSKTKDNHEYELCPVIEEN